MKSILAYVGPYSLDKAKKGDVAHDLKSTIDFEIKPMETKVIPTGICLELDEPFYAEVRPRSGLSSHGLLVHFGTVDTGYRGEIGVMCTNLSGRVMKLHSGDRIAQLFIAKKEEYKLVRVEKISKDTERGSSGFGSTGV